MDQPDKREVAALRDRLEAFLEERRANKMKNATAEEREALEKKYEREAWLADAARRSTQIHLVTHAVKYAHPRAEGSSLYVEPDPEFPDDLVSSSSCVALREDVTGNAAALDVYAFLALEVDGKTLLARVMDNDAALRAAFSDDARRADAWLAAFRDMPAGKNSPATHTLARQVYFPVGEKDYHLLAPLFPTSLVQRAYETLREDRFGEAAASARAARKEEKWCEWGYREYPDLLVQTYGGSKPQNISQLNSERDGENWLLPSCPPQWHSGATHPPLHVVTVFGPILERRPEIRQPLAALRHFLETTAHSNSDIRRTRRELADALVDAVLQWAASVREGESGWTASPLCRLHPSEQRWLDPGREKWNDEPELPDEAGDWRDDVSRRFGRWLNAKLATPKLAMGDAEYREWSGNVKEALRVFAMETAYEQD